MQVKSARSSEVRSTEQAGGWAEAWNLPGPGPGMSGRIFGLWRPGSPQQINCHLSGEDIGGAGQIPHLVTAGS